MQDAIDRRDEETFSIIGAAMEVHREMGCGFLEAVYQESLAIELRNRRIPFEREWPVPIRYKEENLNTIYRADFVCYNSIIVELKALPGLSSTEEAQVLHYMRATGLNKALLINFGRKSLEYKRLIFSK